MTDTARSIAAEARAVEEGHRAFAEGRRYRIVSDTTDHRYRVTVSAMTGGHVLFVCDHPIQRGFADRPAAANPGDCPCKHAALVARRLEREGHLMWDMGRWVLTPATAEVVDAYIAAARPADPFEGL